MIILLGALLAGHKALASPPRFLPAVRCRQPVHFPPSAFASVGCGAPIGCGETRRCSPPTFFWVQRLVCDLLASWVWDPGLNTRWHGYSMAASHDYRGYLRNSVDLEAGQHHRFHPAQSSETTYRPLLFGTLAIMGLLQVASSVAILLHLTGYLQEVGLCPTLFISSDRFELNI